MPERGATAPPPAGPSAARDLNTTRVVGLLRDGGPLTQAELIRRSGLARPTVTAIVRDLLVRHVVVAAGRDTSAVNGRPGSLLAFDPRSETVAVVRVLPGLIEIWVADSEADFLGHRRRSCHVDTVAGLAQLSAEIAQLALDLGLSPPRSIGMLLVGRHDPSTGLCTGPALGADPVPLTSSGGAAGRRGHGLEPDCRGRPRRGSVRPTQRCGGDLPRPRDRSRHRLRGSGAVGSRWRRGRAGSLPAARCDRALPVRSLRVSGDGGRGWFLHERATRDSRSARNGAVDTGPAGGLDHPAIDRLLDGAPGSSGSRPAGWSTASTPGPCCSADTVRGRRRALPGLVRRQRPEERDRRSALCPDRRLRRLDRRHRRRGTGRTRPLDPPLTAGASAGSCDTPYVERAGVRCSCHAHHQHRDRPRDELTTCSPGGLANSFLSICSEGSRALRRQHRIHRLDRIHRIDPVGRFDRVRAVGGIDALLAQQLLHPQQTEQLLDPRRPEQRVDPQPTGEPIDPPAGQRP